MEVDTNIKQVLIETVFAMFALSRVLPIAITLKVYVLAYLHFHYNIYSFIFPFCFVSFLLL